MRVTGDQEGKGIEGIEDKMGVDLVLEGFQLGLGLGDIELFHPGAAVLSFAVEEDDLVYIGNKAGGDDDNEGGAYQGRLVGYIFFGIGSPDTEERGGNSPRVYDIDQEERDDDLMILPEGPGIATPDEMHEPDITLPDQVGDEGEEGIACQEFGIIVEPVGDQSGEVGNKKP